MRWDSFLEEMVRGDTHKFPVVVVNDLTGEPIDITNHAPFEFVATDEIGGTLLLDLTEPANITRTNPSAGELEIEILPGDTSSLANRRWALFAQARAENTAGEIDSTQGCLIIKPAL